jgi:hypothetical protein
MFARYNRAAMSPLTLDDLMPLSEYIAQRHHHVAAQKRYLDRYRRVRVGPRLTLTFENRQTLWFRVHEMLRVARLAEPLRVQQELDLYNRLLPDRGKLQAALHIEIVEDSNWAEQSAAWRTLTEASIRFMIGDQKAVTRLVTCRPEDACFGIAHWVEFAIDNIARAALADRQMSAKIVADFHHYCHRSQPLSEAVRQSLLDDLALSDRDLAA